ncbi:hypothetical protein [Streptomyces sp. NPDC051576]|uniref:hypothetical protein n=1 Tax=Streptomyces sp. NPDC051576 TaxID=3155803 RepID=UPI00344A00F4
MRARTARWGLSTTVLVAAGLALTACDPGVATSATSATGSATSSAQSNTTSTSTPSAKSGQTSTTATGSGTAKKSGVSCTNQINYAGDSRSNAEINSIGEKTGYCPPVSTSGSGTADAGDHSTIVGTLGYLAPGKLIVTPEDGGTDQAFLVSNATSILGAAAICSNSDGTSVTIGDDGYGTSKCTVDQLETAAKTDSVTVRVTMNSQSGGAETVEEKYHP